jgi:flagellar basal-body rod protein FlgC
MSSFTIFDIAGSAMSAQSLRLSTVASNLANADSVSGDPTQVYRAHLPVFQASSEVGSEDMPGVKVTDVLQSKIEPDKRYEPGHPMADADGYVYSPKINVVEQMVDMISASRAYQSNVELMNTAKDLTIRTLSLGR